jgi:putative nucleotidyltransferase with HDIG domain
MGENSQNRIEVFNINNVSPGMRVSQDIKDKNGFLLVSTNMELTFRLIEKLKQFGIINVPIFVTQTIDVNSVQNINLNEIFRQQLLNNVNSSVVRYIKNEPIIHRLVDIITDFTKDDLLMSLLTEIKTIGHNVFVHSINVFALSLLIALKNNFPSDRILITAQASLLHDIGKKFLPKEILDKAHNLTKDENNIFEQHAHFGYEYIESLKNFPYEVARIISQHHERFDGTGFPNSLKGDNIHKIAQIISVADAFDLALDRQELKNRFILSDTIQFLNSASGMYFTPKYVKDLVEEIIVYYMYDWVILSNDDIGIITKLNDSMQLKPVVTVFFDKFRQKYTIPKQVDLSSKSNSNLFIRDILD